MNEARKSLPGRTRVGAMVITQPLIYKSCGNLPAARPGTAKELRI